MQFSIIFNIESTSWQGKKGEVKMVSYNEITNHCTKKIYT